MSTETTSFPATDVEAHYKRLNDEMAEHRHWQHLKLVAHIAADLAANEPSNPFPVYQRNAANYAKFAADLVEACESELNRRTIHADTPQAA